MEPSQLQTIFDRFYQEKGFLRRTATNTGLGLPICRRLIQQLGSEIWVKSVGRNQGSHFYFTVPVAQLQLFSPPSPQIWGEQDSKSPKFGGFRGLKEFASVVYSFENGCKLLTTLTNIHYS